MGKQGERQHSNLRSASLYVNLQFFSSYRGTSSDASVCRPATHYEFDQHVLLDPRRCVVRRLWLLVSEYVCSQLVRFVHSVSASSVLDKLIRHLSVGEDALANLSIERLGDGTLQGHVRIRSKTQGIALSLGDKSMFAALVEFVLPC